jgi:hypothetical protein
MRTIRRSERMAIATTLGAVLVIGVLVGIASATDSTTLKAAASTTPIKLHAAIELGSGAPQVNGTFGFATAVANGYVAVGAIGETDGGYRQAGNVYVYSATTGHEVAQISSPSPKLDGFFGYALAMSGTTLVVGAPNETASGPYLNAGNTYLYTVSGGTVSYKCTLTDPAPLAGTPSSIGSGFGYSVAISGTDVLVSAPGVTIDGLSQAGTAYIFSATSCDLISTLSTLNPVVYGVFGWSVAIRGTTAYVGAPEEGSGGHVYMVLDATSAPADRTTYVLASPNAQPGWGYFGYSVAASGNYLVISAARENVSGVQVAGNVYLYNSSTGVLTMQLTNPSPQFYGEFGFQVAVSGMDVVVGAPGDAAFGAEDAGNATVFNATTGAILTTLTSPDFQYAGSFGFSVAADSACIVVGAPGETAGTVVGAGHAYIY